jgi:hypothetical protein
MHDSTYSETSLWNDMSETLDQHQERFGEFVRSVEEWATPGGPDGPDEKGCFVVRLYLHFLEELGTSLKESGRFLRPMGRIADKDPETIQETVNVLKTTPLLEDVVKLGLARSFVDDIDAAAKRCVALLPALVHGPLSEDSERYLEFVSRCYISGHDTEAVILARTVLETAFRDHVRDARVYEMFERYPSRFPRSHHAALTNRYPPALADRIVAAAASGRLRDASKARTIKKRGDEAVHGEMTFADAAETIYDLAVVLSELQNQRHDPPNTR